MLAADAINLLALETSGRSGSVAILRAQQQSVRCDSQQLDTGSGSAKTLAPAIERLLISIAMNVNELSAIALLTGPGSFTGLRVGVATAKAMAYALQIPAVEIDTLDAIAFQIAPRISKDVAPFHVVFDAYRGQVFHAIFESTSQSDTGIFDRSQDTQIVDIDWLLKKLGAGTGIVSIVGPGCDRIQKHLQDPEAVPPHDSKQLMDRIRWLDGEEAFPQAESVARLGFSKLMAGETLDPFHLSPRYYRGSAAEELALKAKLG
jgi:tRNA threonylcarbamoyladenosine biosynthesis protein TsaB